MLKLIFNLIKSKIPFVASKVASEENIERVIKKAKKEINSVKVIPAKKKKDPAWQRCIPFTFFYGNGKFQPIYFFVTVFLSLASWMLYIKIYAAMLAVKAGVFTAEMISTADLTVVLGFVSSLILLYNKNKVNTISAQTPPDVDGSN